LQIGNIEEEKSKIAEKKDILEFQLNEINSLELKENEEELNRIFIDIYGLQDELTSDVSDKDITIAKINRYAIVFLTILFITYLIGHRLFIQNLR